MKDALRRIASMGKAQSNSPAPCLVRRKENTSFLCKYNPNSGGSIKRQDLVETRINSFIVLN